MKHMVVLNKDEIASFILRVLEPKEVFPLGDKYGSIVKVTGWMRRAIFLVNMLDLSVTPDSDVRRHGNKGSQDMPTSMKDYVNASNMKQALWENVPTGKVGLTVECYHPTERTHIG